PVLVPHHATDISPMSPLSLHDALPIYQFYEVARAHPPLMKRFLARATHDLKEPELAKTTGELLAQEPESLEQVLIRTIDAAKGRDRKSTRLNSSHRTISYAVFCLKKKK